MENLSLVNDAKSPQTRPLAVTDSSLPAKANRLIPAPARPIRMVQHLDVDEVLRRSLPKVSE